MRVQFWPLTIGASTLPQQTYIESNKESLLEECRFFGLEDLALRISGHTVSNDLRPADRRLKRQEDELRASSDVHPSEKSEARFLIDVSCQDSSPLDPLGIGLPILRNQGCTRPKMKCENYQSFRIRCISRELSYVGTCVSIELHWHAIRRNGVHAPVLAHLCTVARTSCRQY